MPTTTAEQQRKRVSGIAAFLAAALVVAGSLAASARAQSAVTPSTITIGVPTMPPYSNPFRSISGPQFHLNYMVFDTPTFIDSSGTLVMRALESLESVDERTWRLTLREGIVFHDGTPMTAEDLAFTLTYALDPDNAYAVRARSGSMTAEVVDDRTVQVITEKPDPLFDRRLTLFPIVPRAQLEALGTDEFMKAPIGSGPFRLVEYVPDQRVVLERFDNYWGEAAGVDRIVLLSLRDPATRLSALLNGDIDIAQGILHDQADTIERAGNLQVVSAPVSMTMVFDLNTIGGHEALKDRRVRQAINYAVDKEAILDGIFLGFGQVLDGQMITPEVVGYNPEVSAYEYDPERSRALLAEAGYGPGEVSLVLSYAEGFYPPGTSDVPEAIAAYLGDVGITVTVNPLEYSRYLEFFYGEVDGDLFGWPPRSVASDAEFVYPFLTCGSAKPSWCNEEFDRLFNASRQELDRAERERLLREATALMHEEAPLLFLLQPGILYGVSNRVSDFVVSPHDFILLNELRLQ